MRIPHLVILSLICLGGTAMAQTVHVVDPAGGPGVFTSIQAAINAATSNDTVEVLPGTYFETIDFMGKDIAVIAGGPGGPAAHVIDAQGAGTVVTFRNGEGSNALLSGFTVTGGWADQPGSSTAAATAGGIVIWGSNPRIENCVVSGNQGWTPGIGQSGLVGGITVATSVICIKNCEISANIGGAGGNAGSFVGGDGGAGGLMLQYGDLELVDCVIDGNVGGAGGAAGSVQPCSGFPCHPWAGPAGHGASGGIAVAPLAGSITLDRCDFAANVSGQPGQGGAQFGEVGAAIGVSNWGPATVTGCSFSGHASAIISGPVFLTLSRCSIRQNTTSSQLFTVGGFPANPVSFSVPIRDCEFIDNVATSGALELPSAGLGGVLAIERCTFVGSGGLTSSSTYSVADSILWGFSSLTNLNITNSCVQGGAPGVGNFSSDPRFRDPVNGDFRLSASSPCIDAGAGATLPSDRDLEGDPRSFYGGPDIGADEYVASCFRGQGEGVGLLTVDSSSSPLVVIPIGQVATIALDQPASHPGAAPFVIWGMWGSPTLQQTGVSSPFGELCFVPYHLAPGQPGLVTLANSAFPDPSAIVPAVPGAWSLAIPTGGFAGVTVTLQGLVEDQPGSYVTTNAVVVAIQ